MVSFYHKCIWMFSTKNNLNDGNQIDTRMTTFICFYFFTSSGLDYHTFLSSCRRLLKCIYPIPSSSLLPFSLSLNVGSVFIFSRKFKQHVSEKASRKVPQQIFQYMLYYKVNFKNCYNTLKCLSGHVTSSEGVEVDWNTSIDISHGRSLWKNLVCFKFFAICLKEYTDKKLLQCSLL